MNMKKICFLFILVLSMVLFAASALADAQSEWNQQCVLKTGSAASVYVWHTNSVASPTDLEAGTLDPVRTLLAGTYIKRSADDNICAAYHMAKISYCLNGSVSTGYIESSLVASATSRVRLANGQYVNVPEALMLDYTALSKYLWAHYGMGVAQTPEQQPAGDVPDGGKPAREPVSDPGAYALSYILTNVEEDSVTTLHADMVVPGIVWSTIQVAGETRTVPTMDLYWPSVAPDDQLLASVYAPKTGKATIYSGSSNRTKVLGKADAGRVVLVLKVGTYFCRVWSDGVVGYMQTSALTFHGIVDPAVTSTAVIVKNDRTDGAAKINMRIDNKANTRIIGVYPTGTPVTVLSTGATWTEIEVDGLHGYIQSKHLKAE